MKTKFFVTILVSLLLISVVSASMIIPVNEKAKENAKAPENSVVIDNTDAGEWELVAPNIRSRVKGELVQYEIIHYKKGYGKQGTAGAKVPNCYGFISATKPKWKSLPAGYVINPSNPQGLSESFITSSILTSAETWDFATSKELFNNAYGIDYTAKYGVQNYKNALVFGNYPEAGVIAVTSIWWNPATKSIVEFDILLDTDFLWGDATLEPSKMDLQNIATHELGHGVGLGDLYSSTCSEVTMYGYSNYGETKKRTLEKPDITGLQTLYGI